MAKAILTTSSIIQQSLKVLENEFERAYEPIYSIRKEPNDLFSLEKHMVGFSIETVASGLTYDEVCALYKLTCGGEPRWDTEAK